MWFVHWFCTESLPQAFSQKYFLCRAGIGTDGIVINMDKCKIAVKVTV